MNMRTDTEELTRWASTEGLVERPGLEARARPELLQVAVDHLDRVTVRSVEVNRTGSYTSPQGEVDDLPPYIDVRLHITSPGGHVAHVVVWAPLAWSGRFLGTAGGGNRTDPQWVNPPFLRAPSLAEGIRNGFAAARTDAGNRDRRLFGWGLDEETGEIDWDLTENWAHRSTHEMTVAAKAVIEAVYGEPPAFSYLAGTSGGGRQTLALAQRTPDDYDGYWASCPAINWSRLHVAQIWPALVMKELGNPLAPAKLAAFHDAAVAEFGDDDGIIDTTEYVAWDPFGIVGTPTPAGEISERDAEVMRLIWEGPTDADGTPLWFGMSVGSESWGSASSDLGLMCTTEEEGLLKPSAFAFTRDWIANWVLKDPDWDWTTLTFEGFREIFHASVAEFSGIDIDDPDLTGLQRSGGKLLLSHGMADGALFSQGTVRYYERVLETTGGRTSTFLRFFLSPGDAHAMVTGKGPGISMASGMRALVDWVEHGTAPEVVPGTRYDLESRSVTLRRPIHRYPAPTKS